MAIGRPLGRTAPLQLSLPGFRRHTGARLSSWIRAEFHALRRIVHVASCKIDVLHRPAKPYMPLGSAHQAPRARSALPVALRSQDRRAPLPGVLAKRVVCTAMLDGRQTGKPTSPMAKPISAARAHRLRVSQLRERCAVSVAHWLRL